MLPKRPVFLLKYLRIRAPTHVLIQLPLQRADDLVFRRNILLGQGQEIRNVAKWTIFDM